MTQERLYYNQILKALQQAFDACYNHPGRDVLGMSHGPFSGVNVALGIVADLEKMVWNFYADNTNLRKLLKEKENNMTTIDTQMSATPAIATLPTVDAPATAPTDVVEFIQTPEIIGVESPETMTTVAEPAV